jgi:hypothetical protein
MKTKAALALSLTGILLTGSAALAANTQTLSSSTTGTSDDARNVLVTDDSATRTAAPAPARVVPKAAPKATTKTSDNVKADDKKASAAKKVSAAKKSSHPAEPGDDTGRTRTTPEPAAGHRGLVTVNTFTGNGGTVAAEPGDDKGGLRTTSEPGDDNGGLRKAQAPRAAQTGYDKGGLRTTPEPGDDKGGLRKAPEPGDDSGGHGGRGSGSDD